MTARSWLALLGLLPIMACASPPTRSEPVHPRHTGEPRWTAEEDRIVPIRAASDVVGRYRSIPDGREVIEIAEGRGSVLTITSSHRPRYEVVLKQDGDLSVPGSGSARLLRRGERTLLRVLWCYMELSYERIETGPG
jgi:hypothetical protein